MERESGYRSYIGEEEDKVIMFSPFHSHFLGTLSWPWPNGTQNTGHIILPMSRKVTALTLTGEYILGRKKRDFWVDGLNHKEGKQGSPQ